MSLTIAWEYYRSFLSVLREGSLSGGARSLGITQPTVGRHIDSLERSFGLVLFTRSPTGLLPTEAALALKALVEDMEHTAATLERTALSQGEGVQGVVRVTASEIIGVEVLPSIVTSLRETHPRLKIELVLTDRVQDLLRREADIAVRMTRPQQDQLIARHVGSIDLGLHASRQYVEKYGQPAELSCLAEHAVIGFDQVTPFIRNATKDLPKFERETFSLRTDSNLAQLALIRSGAGIGVCQVALARRNTNLIRILPQAFSLNLGTWITMHEGLRNSLSCRVTFDALVKGMQDYIGIQNQ